MEPITVLVHQDAPGHWFTVGLLGLVNQRPPGAVEAVLAAVEHDVKLTRWLLTRRTEQTA